MAVGVKSIDAYKLFITFTPPQYYLFGDDTTVSNVVIDVNENVIYDVFVVQRYTETHDPDIAWNAFTDTSPEVKIRTKDYAYTNGLYQEKGVLRMDGLTAQPIQNRDDPTVLTSQLVIDGSSDSAVYMGWEIAVEIHARIQGIGVADETRQIWARTLPGETDTPSADMDTNRRPQKPTNLTVKITADTGALDYAIDVMEMEMDNTTITVAEDYKNFIRDNAATTGITATAPTQIIYIPSIATTPEEKDVEFQLVANRVLRGNYGYHTWTVISRSAEQTVVGRTRYLAYVLIDPVMNAMETSETIIPAIEGNFNNTDGTLTTEQNPDIRLFKRVPVQIGNADGVSPSAAA